MRLVPKILGIAFALVVLSCLALYSTEQAILRRLNPLVEFHGKLVDQDGQPIADARVRADVRGQGITWGRGPGTRLDLVTDREGKFSIQGVRGIALEMRPVKDGYDIEPLTLYKDAIWKPRPDASTPSPIVAWKRGEVVPVRHWDHLYTVSPTGEPCRINLKTGRRAKSESDAWDVAISAERTPHLQHNVPFDWKLTINTPPDAGLQCVDSPHLFLAPPDGYVKSWSAAAAAADPNWSPRLHRQFYYRSAAGGTYAALKINVQTAQADDRVNVTIEATVNDDGSRNLYYNGINGKRE